MGMSEQPPPSVPEQEPVKADSTPQPAHAASAADWLRVAVGKAKTLVLSLAAKSKAAGQLAAKQAERAKLTQIALPNAYRPLGKHIHGAGSFRADFQDIYARIDTLLTEISILSAEKPKVQGFAEKAKAVAKAAKDKTQIKALNIMVNRACTELGKAAFEKHGDKSGPAELVRPILDCRGRLEELAAEDHSTAKA
jgi:hypothetical protein